MSHKNLHCGPKWAFNGLARWAEVVLNGYLKPIRHIVESTAEFVQRLRGVKPHLDAFVVRIDVSDFYMSGDAVSFARDASAIIPGKECRSLMDDVLLFFAIQPVCHQFSASVPRVAYAKQAAVWG